MKKLRLSAAGESGPAGFAFALLFVAASTLAGLAIAPRWGSSAVDLLYLPAVIGTALLAGRWPAMLAAVASTLAYNYFFTAPFHTFRIHSPSDVMTVVLLFAVALTASQLAAAVRAQARRADAHAQRNATIAGFARRLLSSSGERDIAAIAAREIAALFDCNTLLLSAQGEPAILATSAPGVAPTPSDLAVAALVIANATPAGRGIAPSLGIEWQFHPIVSDGAVIAVAGLARDDGKPATDDEGRRLLANLLDQAALAFERARLDAEARNFASNRDRDQVRSTLLASIAGDISPPLARIGAGIDRLRRSGGPAKAELAEIGAEAAKLRRYLAEVDDLAPGAEQAPVAAGGIVVDLFRRSVTRDGEPVHLTPKEYAVLAELAKHPGRVLSHAHLLRAAWGPAHEKQADYLRVAIRGLRSKIEADPAHPQLIINHPSVGYRLAV